MNLMTLSVLIVICYCIVKIVEGKFTCPFDIQTNFSGPLTTSDGKPYAPIRFKDLIKECYQISKNSGATYEEVLNMTFREKDYFIEFINEDFKATEDSIKESREALRNSYK